MEEIISEEVAMDKLAIDLLFMSEHDMDIFYKFLCKIWEEYNKKKYNNALINLNNKTYRFELDNKGDMLIQCYIINNRMRKRKDLCWSSIISVHDSIDTILNNINRYRNNIKNSESNDKNVRYL